MLTYRFIFAGLLFLTISCSRTLPDEQKKRLMDEADARKIQRVTEQEIIGLVQEKGEELVRLTTSTDSTELIVRGMRQFLGTEHQVDHVLPGQASRGELQEVLEAYMFSVAEGSEPGANLQKLESGNILYTIPQIRDSSGIKVLTGLWKVEFVRKDMVREIVDRRDQ